MSNKAVLTGDIVGSSYLNPTRRQDLYKIFAQLSKLLQKNFPEDIGYDVSNFRGDSWQLIANRPEKSLEISLFIRTFLRFSFKEEKIDTRIAIGIGATAFIPKENISAGDGPAYIVSGHLLEALSGNRMVIGFADKSKEFLEREANSFIRLMDFIITSWGASQSQAVYWALQGLKQKEIVAHWSPLPISQAAVSRSLTTAGWEQISDSIRFFELLIKKYLETN